MRSKLFQRRFSRHAEDEVGMEEDEDEVGIGDVEDGMEVDGGHTPGRGKATKESSDATIAPCQIRHEGHDGNVFYTNDLKTILEQVSLLLLGTRLSTTNNVRFRTFLHLADVASVCLVQRQDFANPNTSPDCFPTLHGGLQGLMHSDLLTHDLPPSIGSPMIILPDGRHAYVLEPCQLKDNQFFFPLRWIRDDRKRGELAGMGWFLKVTGLRGRWDWDRNFGGENLVSHLEIVEVHPNLVREDMGPVCKCQLACPMMLKRNKRVLTHFFVCSSFVCFSDEGPEDLDARWYPPVSPARKLAKGLPFFRSYFALYDDGHSETCSMKANPHESYYLSHVSIPPS
jgi:hypothetical protein